MRKSVFGVWRDLGVESPSTANSLHLHIMYIYSCLQFHFCLSGNRLVGFTRWLDLGIEKASGNSSESIVAYLKNTY